MPARGHGLPRSCLPLPAPQQLMRMGSAEFAAWTGASGSLGPPAAAAAPLPLALPGGLAAGPALIAVQHQAAQRLAVPTLPAQLAAAQAPAAQHPAPQPPPVSAPPAAAAGTSAWPPQ